MRRRQPRAHSDHDGLDDAESIARAYEQGATDFITKPLNPVILSNRVRYMLRGSHTLDALLRSEARLGFAQRIAKIGNWEWRPDTNQFTASTELCRLMGIRPRTLVERLMRFSISSIRKIGTVWRRR